MGGRLLARLVVFLALRAMSMGRLDSFDSFFTGSRPGDLALGDFGRVGV